MRIRESILGDIGDANAPPGSERWAKSVRLDIQQGIHDVNVEVDSLQSSLEAFRHFEAWKSLKNRKGCPFQSYKDFCVESRPWGLGCHPNTIRVIVRERRKKQKEDAMEKARDRVLPKRNNGSNTSVRRIKKLRDRNPEAAERLERGEFKSVRAAERWARGEEPHPARAKKTELDWLLYWWNKASETTHQKFLKQIGKG